MWCVAALGNTRIPPVNVAGALGAPASAATDTRPSSASAATTATGRTAPLFVPRPAPGIDPALLCQNCDEKPAAVWCVECGLRLCSGATNSGSGGGGDESCARVLHRHHAMRAHTRLPFAPGMGQGAAAATTAASASASTSASAPAGAAVDANPHPFSVRERKQQPFSTDQKHADPTAATATATATAPGSAATTAGAADSSLPTGAAAPAPALTPGGAAAAAAVMSDRTPQKSPHASGGSGSTVIDMHRASPSSASSSASLAKMYHTASNRMKVWVFCAMWCVLCTALTLAFAANWPLVESDWLSASDLSQNVTVRWVASVGFGLLFHMVILEPLALVVSSWVECERAEAKAQNRTSCWARFCCWCRCCHSDKVASLADSNK
jgi:hypothetical protein